MNHAGYVDCRAKKKEKFKAYTLKDAIFNWAEAWKKVPLSTLRNGWCKLLKTPKAPAVGKDDFEGFETSRMVDMIHQAGQGEIEPDELVDWVQEDFNVPGYHYMTAEEIAGSLQNETEAEEEEDGEATGGQRGVSGSWVGSHFNLPQTK